MSSHWPQGTEDHTRGKGTAAERAAMAWLERRGYRVVGRNVVTAAGEIDLVALDGEMLCFVEVKARAGRGWGHSLEAVDRRKQRRLVRAAALFVALHGHDGGCRFDVLGLDLDGGRWRCTLVRDAFGADY